MTTPCLCTNRKMCQLYQHLHGGGFSAQDLELHEQARKKRVYKRGEKLFEQDRDSTGLYCVQSGHVLLKSVDRFGNETAFRVAGPGELMGQRSFFAGEPHTATALALGRTYVCFHPRAIINRLLDSSIHLAKCFLRDLARDPGPADSLKLRNMKLPLRIRLLYLLVIIKEFSDTTSNSGALTFGLPLRRVDIAALIGARPESVTRVIKALEDDGIAIFHDHEVTVPHMEQLLETITMEMENSSTNAGKDASGDFHRSVIQQKIG